jgi:hypothetical protein
VPNLVRAMAVINGETPYLHLCVPTITTETEATALMQDGLCFCLSLTVIAFHDADYASTTFDLSGHK